MEAILPPKEIVVVDSKKQLKIAYTAIASFVDEIYDTFSKTAASDALELYKRLFVRIDPNDMEQVKRVVTGYINFFREHGACILTNKIGDLPRGAVIRFDKSEKVYLEIQRYVYKSGAETRQVIREHLLTIHSLFASKTPSDSEDPMGLKRLGVNPNTKEGKFVGEIFETMSSSVDGIDVSNPMTAFAAIMQSGVFQKLTDGFQNGQMNPRALIGTLKNMLEVMAPDETSDPNARSDLDFLSNKSPPPAMEDAETKE